MNKITLENGLAFELNNNDSTAKIIYSPNARGHLNISRSIVYQDHLFTITSISNGSFKNNKKIKSITFDEDSSLFLIENNSFKSSKIESLFLPSSVKDLQKGWCKNTPKLKNISISSKNPNFKYIDDEHQIIAKKSDKNSENFDVIIFANRNIKKAVIPSSIKIIDSYSFDQCKKLHTIEISEDSELRSIGKNSFRKSIIESLFISSKVEILNEGWCNETSELNSIIISPKNPNFKYIDDEHQIIAKKSDKNSDNFDVIIFANRNIKYIEIPSSITIIDSYSFDQCEELQAIEILEDSELRKIGKKSFRSTCIERFFIPSKVEEIQEGWINHNWYLIQISLSPKNPNFKYLDENQQIIIGKSDTKSQKYDVIICSSKDIKEILIPSSIKYIYSYAFFYCIKLKKIEFEPKSELLSIGKSAFYKTAIEEIKIPKGVVSIGNSCFQFCEYLQSFELEKGSKLQEISDKMFIFDNKLSHIEIPKDSHLRCIGTHAFGNTEIKRFYIPSSVEVIRDGWCCWTSKLFNVFISPDNKHFKYLDEKHQIIVGRSNPYEDNFDAIIFASRNIDFATIPKFIKEIKSCSFNECSNLTKIIIPNDSELQIIGSSSFGDSKINEIFIPSKVEILEKDCFDLLPSYFKIVISHENQNFGYLDDKHQIIVGKSDTRKDEFDEIIFADRNIKSITIPSSIKFISKYSFSRCSDLEKVTFSEDSQLQSIGKFAFNYSAIEEFTLPKNVEKIGRCAFSDCENLVSFNFLSGSKMNRTTDDLFIFDDALENVEIPEDSDFRSIAIPSFKYTSIKSLFIPAKVKEIIENSFSNAIPLTNITISSNNKNYKYADENQQIIVKKGCTGIFDILFFANRNVKKVTISNSIKHICPTSFENCKQLKKVVFQENSNLQSIGKYAFTSSAINSINIPKKVRLIDTNAFDECNYLESLEFLGNKLLNGFNIFHLTNECPRLSIISFPNVKVLTINLTDSNKNHNCLFMVSAKTEIKY